MEASEIWSGFEYLSWDNSAISSRLFALSFVFLACILCLCQSFSRLSRRLARAVRASPFQLRFCRYKRHAVVDVRRAHRAAREALDAHGCGVLVGAVSLVRQARPRGARVLVRGAPDVRAQAPWDVRAAAHCEADEAAVPRRRRVRVPQVPVCARRPHVALQTDRDALGARRPRRSSRRERDPKLVGAVSIAGGRSHSERRSYAARRVSLII